MKEGLLAQHEALIHALPPLRVVVEQHGIRQRKAWGQHFLFDLNLTGRIAAAIPDITRLHIYEVGPGPGALTRTLLLCGAKRVTVVEQDARCIPALQEIQAIVGERLHIIEEDALAIEEKDLVQEGEPLYVASNLPYNISTALWVKWLGRLSLFSGFTLMFQKEVAARIMAESGSHYGRLAVLSTWLCEVRRVFDVPPSAFVPPPKVDSSVISATPRSAPLYPAHAEHLQRVSKAAFGQRRKMLRRSLAPLFDDVESVLQSASVDPRMRPEQLSVEKFCHLARLLEASGDASQ